MIPSFTGFTAEGVHRRNEVINYPVQGNAFHCLLWSLIETMKALRKYKMKSVVIGQIHDSMISDVPDNELQDYLNITEEITAVKLRKHWDWINVPVGTEVEVSPAGGSWADKGEWSKNKHGIWGVAA
jgi:DNA polymerase I-like protein with 3'-5' exonuclease and polymerase domains